MRDLALVLAAGPDWLPLSTFPDTSLFQLTGRPPRCPSFPHAYPTRRSWVNSETIHALGAGPARRSPGGVREDGGPGRQGPTHALAAAHARPRVEEGSQAAAAGRRPPSRPWRVWVLERELSTPPVPPPSRLPSPGVSPRVALPRPWRRPPPSNLPGGRGLRPASWWGGAPACRWEAWPPPPSPLGLLTAARPLAVVWTVCRRRRRPSARAYLSHAACHRPLPPPTATAVTPPPAPHRCQGVLPSPSSVRTQVGALHALLRSTATSDWPPLSLSSSGLDRLDLAVSLPVRGRCATGRFADRCLPWPSSSLLTVTRPWLCGSAVSLSYVDSPHRCVPFILFCPVRLVLPRWALFSRHASRHP